VQVLILSYHTTYGGGKVRGRLVLVAWSMVHQYVDLKAR
jgi:hypothetical protein